MTIRVLYRGIDPEDREVEIEDYLKRSQAETSWCMKTDVYIQREDWESAT